MGWEDPRETFRWATFVGADYIPFNPVEAAYLVGNTPSNELSLLERGLKIYRMGQAKTVVLDGGRPYFPPGRPPGSPNAYSGGDAWKLWLGERGVQNGFIKFVDSPRPSLSHTGTDAERFVTFAKHRGWRTVTIVACPNHMLRSFVIAVSQAALDYPDLLIYARVGTPLPWDEEGTGSQGKAFKTRLLGTDVEWDRMIKHYGNRYDPLGPDDIAEYVGWRDAEARRLLGDAYQRIQHQ